MRSELINPFIEATVSTFETMCRLKPVRSGNLQIRDGMITTYDFVGILGLSGSVKGAVVMSMPVELGKVVIGKFVGEAINEVNADLMDGFGEILNIIAGAAAAKIDALHPTSELEKKITLALPTVVIGKDQQLSCNKDKPWVIIPMVFKDLGAFDIEVAMEEK